MPYAVGGLSGLLESEQEPVYVRDAVCGVAVGSARRFQLAAVHPAFERVRVDDLPGGLREQVDDLAHGARVVRFEYFLAHDAPKVVDVPRVLASAAFDRGRRRVGCQWRVAVGVGACAEVDGVSLVEDA